MSAENIRKFYEAVSRDKSLQQRLIPEATGSVQEDFPVELVLSAAREAGFPFSEEDLRQYIEESTAQGPDAALKDWGPCICIMGGGRNETDDCTCACVVDGGGNRDRDGYYLYCVLTGSVDLIRH